MQMSARPTLFVSHAAEDQEIVTVSGDLLAALSLQQLQIWFLSDKRADGGLQPGDIWFQQIQERLKSCAAILVVITDKSVDRPWIYFESGYGSASPEKKLFVVTCGISSLSQISPPLFVLANVQGRYEGRPKLVFKQIAKNYTGFHFLSFSLMVIPKSI